MSTTSFLDILLVMGALFKSFHGVSCLKKILSRVGTYFAKLTISIAHFKQIAHKSLNLLKTVTRKMLEN